jgi:two-component system chemotaxis response regulator CheB
MLGHDIVVIGASAGGVEALTTLVEGLPADLPASIFIVLHVSPYGTSALPAILRRTGRLPVKHAVDGETIRSGQVYVAPPNHHLLIQPGYVRVTSGAEENGNRPAIDPLFRTAARAYGSRVVGVVLSGALDDGTAGLQAIKVQDGIAVVQDPEEAVFDGMPRSAVENVDVDYVVPLSSVAPLLSQLVHEPAKANSNREDDSRQMDPESEMAELDMSAIESENQPGTPSAFVCPTCAGVLWEIEDGSLVRYRCRVGHAFSPESLLAGQSAALEAAVWAAFRALDERASLLKRLAENARRRPYPRVADRFARQAADAERNATLIRDSLFKNISAVDEDPPANRDIEAKSGS